MKRILGVVGITAVLTTVSPARADHAEELAAQTLYDKALELMKAGKAAAACPLLAESQRLDPAAGTQYRLAECFEKTGRLEAAWKLYTEATEASKKAGRKDRETQAHERAVAVWKLLPRLTITISPELAKADGLAVTRDGRLVPREEWNQEAPTEPGEHTIDAKASGKKTWRGTMTARAGTTEEVQIPVLEAAVVMGSPIPEVAPPVSAEAVEPPRASASRAVVIAGAALAAIGAGVGIGFMVKSSAKSDERENLIAADPLNASCVPGSHKCTDAVRDVEAIRASLARVSFAGYLAAGLIGAGTLTYALFPRSPKKEERPKATVVAGPGFAAVTLSGTW